MFKNLGPSAQVVVFILLIFMMSAAGNIIYSISLSLAIDPILIETTNLEDPRISLSSNFFSQIFGFLMAFLVYLKLTGEQFSTLVYDSRITIKPLLIAVSILVAAYFISPILETINAPLSHILPPSMIENERIISENQTALIVQNNGVQFIFTLIVFAIVPAICEELVFRGFLIKKMMTSGMGENGAILMSAAIFALIHLQPLKILVMFFLGACFGYVYLRYKNIKYPIIMHFLFNGVQITLGYLAGSGLINMDF